jgi:hypothetical protein
VQDRETGFDDLVELLISRLEQRGAPSGLWLVEIAEARRALQKADDVLRRLQDAIIREAEDRPLES